MRERRGGTRPTPPSHQGRVKSVFSKRFSLRRFFAGLQEGLVLPLPGRDPVDRPVLDVCPGATPLQLPRPTAATPLQQPRPCSCHAVFLQLPALPAAAVHLRTAAASSLTLCGGRSIGRAGLGYDVQDDGGQVSSVYSTPPHWLAAVLSLPPTAIHAVAPAAPGLLAVLSAVLSLSCHWPFGFPFGCPFGCPFTALSLSYQRHFTGLSAVLSRFC